MITTQVPMQIVSSICLVWPALLHCPLETKRENYEGALAFSISLAFFLYESLTLFVSASSFLQGAVLFLLADH